MRDENGLKGLTDLCDYARGLCDIQTVVEIGSCLGESAFVFAIHFPTVHCIDPWVYDKGEVEIQAGHSLDEIEQTFDRLIVGFPTTIVKHKGRSSEVVSDWTLPIDMLYVDGDHSFSGVDFDLRAWTPYVKQGGVIAGHDYDDPRYPGVRQAALQFFPESKIKTFRDLSWMAWKE
jgi:hypothetical protein